MEFCCIFYVPWTVSAQESLSYTQILNTRDSEMPSLLFCLCRLRNWPQCSAFVNANRTAGLLNLTELEYRVLQGLERSFSLWPLQNYVLIRYRQSVVSCEHKRSMWLWCCKYCYMQSRTASFRTEIMWSMVSVNERFLIVLIKLPPYSSLYLLLSLLPFEIHLFFSTSWMCDWYQ